MDAAGEERTVRRIIALLVSFAVLAERSAARSLPVRWLVLVLLRHAEVVVVGFAVEATAFDPACLADDPEAGYSPMDAAVLA